jgi:hypothetical protein
MVAFDTRRGACESRGMKTRADLTDSGSQRTRDRGHLAWLGAAVTAGLVAVGCGGAPAPEAMNPGGRDIQPHVVRQDGSGHAMAGGPEGAKGSEDGDGDQGTEHEMAMPAPLAKFHDTLAPRWHAEHSAKRTADTCAAIPQFRSDADAVASSAPPPGSDAAVWSAGGKQLAEAVAGLDAACKASDAAAFEPAFALVHQRFHGLMEAAGGER